MKSTYIDTITPLSDAGGERGFTLVEIMIVLAIIGILAATAIMSFTHSKERARVGACIATLGSIRIGMEDYYNDHRQYPPMPINTLADLATELEGHVNISTSQTTCRFVSYDADQNSYDIETAVDNTSGITTVSLTDAGLTHDP